MTIAKLKHESKPNNLEWLLNYSDAPHQMGDTEKAIDMYEGCKGSVLRGGRVLISLGQVSCNSRQGGRGEEFSKVSV
jgi:hypothetical protein